MYIAITLKRYRAVKEAGEIKMHVGSVAYYQLMLVCQVNILLAFGPVFLIKLHWIQPNSYSLKEIETNQLELNWILYGRILFCVSVFCLCSDWYFVPGAWSSTDSLIKTWLKPLWKCWTLFLFLSILTLSLRLSTENCLSSV